MDIGANRNLEPDLAVDFGVLLGDRAGPDNANSHK
jgi:hypothetical protein